MPSLSLVLLIMGCAPATVDLVQPNVVAKATFQGEWFTLDTVSSVPYGTAATFEGAQGDLSRVQWRVEEDLLVGVRAYDNIGAADPNGSDAAVVAYRIEKHFDIRRAYNPTTGEETNVVEENVERPWFERAYMRVDWSRNLASAGSMPLAGANVRVGAWVDTDPRSALAPQFDDSDGDGVIDHIQLFVRALAEPDQVQIDGYGGVPTCLFYGQATTDCAPQEVVVSTAFRLVDPDHAYVGLAWPDTWMDTFGFFSTERMRYDRRYGVTETERVRWANRHDLWEDALARDPAGQPLCRARGMDDAPCATFTADQEPKPVERDYADRTPRPVVYHVGPDFDASLVPALDRIERAWNEPLADVINQLRFWECLDARNADADACADRIDPDLQMFVICRNNPSQPGDPDVCNTDHTGPARRPDGVPDVARAGDLRYNFLNLIDQPQIYSPLGYGPSAADPVGARIPLADGELELGAGELIAANANIYTSGLDRIAAATTDLIRLIEGDLPPEDYISGENVEAWIEELRENGSSAGMVGEVGQRAPVAPLRSVDVDPRARAAFDTIDGAWTGRTHDALSALPRPSDSFALRRWLIDADERIAASGALPPAGLSGRIAWDRMRSSGLDHPLWSAETMAASGVDPALTGSAPLDARSPLDPLGPEAIDTQALAALDAGRRGLDLDDGEIINPTLIGLARRYRAEGLDYEQILARIREEMFVSVTLHEVGHTLGLRHNFAASTDAWNYHPRYWELRDDGAMGPRHVDPETPEEIEGQIREFQYSSVMDYPGNHNGDWHGLGAYDRAAIRFGYGELVEVMTEPRAEPVLEGIPNETTIAIVAAWNDSTLFPSAVVGGPDGSIQDLHYTDYPRVANLGARAIVPWKRLTALSDPGVQDVPGFDTQLVLDEGVAGVAPAGAPAAPYRFCSDEYATGAMCARFDEGADAYEIIHYLMQDYWDRYLLDNFARDRYGFGFGDYAQSRYKRTFGPLERWVRNYALLYAVLDAAFDPATAAWMASDRGLGGWTLASADSFRFMTQVVLRPEPGRLSTVRRSDGLERLVPGAVGERSLELGAGAWYSSEWDTDSGYWWFQRWQRIGTYWDRMLAVQALTALSPYDFFGYDTASDPRTFALGYASLWGPQLEGFLGGLIADDLRALAPILDADDRLVYRDLLSDTGWPPAPFADSQVEHGAYWLVRYAAGLYAGAFLQDGFHMGWLDRARIYAEGSAEARTPSELTELVHWEDASTGLTWTAWRFPDAEGVETGAGARLLDHAVRLASVCSGEGPIDTEPDLSTFEREQLRPSACAELDRVADDIALQSRIVAVMSTNVPD